MILCDTNILIEFYKANPTVIQTLQRMGSANIGVSVITKAELFYGARDKQELAKIERNVSLCHCYGLNDAISALFIESMSRYSLSHKVSIPDMLIAATAISHDLSFILRSHHLNSIGMPAATAISHDLSFIP